ncbi:probable deoxyuridine 5'-triphosphate nucleotidohydrolase [Zingiber officinale]|nr:probable deoxyuridine 5'-triphosphate nucleotidohydrolase [Zingiber officinale]
MKTDPAATIPTRRITGVAGYDLTLIHTHIIEASECEMVPTSLAFVIPDGYYGRIAPQSGAARHKGIQIGAGVVDNDFRGEVKILVFNMTYGNLVLNKGEAIVRLILERISTLEVIQVVDLLKTIRGDNGFGSTTADNQITRTNSPLSVHQKIELAIGTLEWEKLMDALLPKISDNNFASGNHRQLHFLTTDDEWLNPFYSTEGGGYKCTSTSFYSAELDIFYE